MRALSIKRADAARLCTYLMVNRPDAGGRKRRVPATTASRTVQPRTNARVNVNTARATRMFPDGSQSTLRALQDVAAAPNGSPCVLVMVYSDYCPYCVQFKPEWRAAADVLGRNGMETFEISSDALSAAPPGWHGLTDAVRMDPEYSGVPYVALVRRPPPTTSNVRANVQVQQNAHHHPFFDASSSQTVSQARRVPPHFETTVYTGDRTARDLVAFVHRNLVARQGQLGH